MVIKNAVPGNDCSMSATTTILETCLWEGFPTFDVRCVRPAVDSLRRLRFVGKLELCAPTPARRNYPAPAVQVAFKVAVVYDVLTVRIGISSKSCRCYGEGDDE